MAKTFEFFFDTSLLSDEHKKRIISLMIDDEKHRQTLGLNEDQEISLDEEPSAIILSKKSAIQNESQIIYCHYNDIHPQNVRLSRSLYESWSVEQASWDYRDETERNIGKKSLLAFFYQLHHELKLRKSALTINDASCKIAKAPSQHYNFVDDINIVDSPTELGKFSDDEEFPEISELIKQAAIDRTNHFDDKPCPVSSPKSLTSSSFGS